LDIYKNERKVPKIISVGMRDGRKWDATSWHKSRILKVKKEILLTGKHFSLTSRVMNQKTSKEEWHSNPNTENKRRRRGKWLPENGFSFVQ
jgi:hypothetical protein